MEAIRYSLHWESEAYWLNLYGFREPTFLRVQHHVRGSLSLQKYPKVGLETANNWLHFIFYNQWRMRKNHWNTLTIYLFGQTAKQPLSNIEPWKFLKYKQFWGLEPDLNCLHGSINFQKSIWKFVSK